jgi:hypothetical protein
MASVTKRDQVSDVACLRRIEPDRNDVVGMEPATALATVLAGVVELLVDFGCLLASPTPDRRPFARDSTPPEIASLTGASRANRSLVFRAVPQARPVTTPTLVPRSATTHGLAGRELEVVMR